MGASLGEAVLELVADRSQLTKDIDSAKREAENSFVSFGERLNKVLTVGIAAGLTAVTTAMGAVTVSGIKMAADFESQMAILSTAASGSGASLDELHDAALAVGGDVTLVGVSATGAADAMTGMFKAGLTSTEVFGDLQGYLSGTAELGGALRAAIDLAAASELDMVQASDLVTVAMKTFGLSADEAAGIANTFVQTADGSVASVSDLYAALQNVGPTAAAFGWSLEDTNTALAVLSTRGIAGSEAGTALKSMMTNLMQTTPDVTKALDELNVSLYTQDGQMRSLPEIIAQLGTSMAGLTEEERNQYVQTLAGSYGMKALNTLLAEGVPGWEAMEESIAGAATAQEVAAARTATFEGKMEALNGALETVKIGIGEAFLPTLTDLVTQLGVFVEQYTPQIVGAFQFIGDWVATNLPQAITTLSNLWTGTLLPAITDVWNYIQTNLIPVFTQLAGVFTNDIVPVVSSFVGEHAEALKGALIGIGTALASMSIAATISGIGSAIAALTNPVTAVIAAAALLGAAWAEDWGGIRTTLTAWWEESGRAIFEQLVTWLQTNIPTAVQTVSDFWTGTLQPALADVWGFINGSLIPTIKDLVESISSFFADTATWWEEHKAAVINTASNLWGSIKTTYDDVSGAIGDALDPWLDKLEGWWAEHGESVRAIVDKLWGSIRDVVDTVSGTINDLVEGFLANILGFWRGHDEDVTSTVDSLWSKVATAFEEAKETVSGIVERLVGAVKSFWDQWGADFEMMAQTTWDNIEVIFDTMLEVLGDIVDAIAAVLEGDWEGFQEAMEGITQDLWDGVKEVFSNSIDTLSTVAGDIVEAVKKRFTDIDWAGIGQSIIDGIKAGIERAKTAVVETATDVVDGVVDGVTDFLGIHSPSTVFAEIGMSLMDGLAKGIWDSAGAAYDAIAKVVDNVLAAASGIIDVADELGSIGSAAGKRYKSTVLEPIEATIDGLEEQIKRQQEIITITEKRAETEGWTNQLMRQRADALSKLAGLHEEMWYWQGKQAEEEQRLLELQQKQADLDYLESQVKLLDVIKQYNLDAAQVLQGVKLGIEANAGSIVDAMTRAMQAMIEQAEDVLGIASPSKVFAEIGEAMMAGMAEGIEGSAYRPAYALAETSSQVSNYTYNLSVPAPIGTITDLSATLQALRMAGG